MSETEDPDDHYAARHKECLTFDAFVRLLQLAHAAGRRHRLEAHYLPQDVACPRRQADKVITANISGVAAYMTTAFFNAYGLEPTLIPHVHSSLHDGSSNDDADSADPAAASMKLSRENMAALCELTAPEYKELDMVMPAFCNSR